MRSRTRPNGGRPESGLRTVASSRLKRSSGSSPVIAEAIRYASHHRDGLTRSSMTAASSSTTIPSTPRAPRTGPWSPRSSRPATASTRRPLRRRPRLARQSLARLAPRPTHSLGPVYRALQR
jgi:hypothetical protein